MSKVFALFLALGIAAPVLAQDGRQADPNFKHFYMARQQVQVIDESPIITNQTGGGGAGGANAPAAAQPLPRASFQSYFQGSPQAPNNLPKVFNGVPPKLPPAPNAMNAQPGKLKPKKAQAKSTYPGLKAYKPYSGYGGSTPSTGDSSGTSSTSSNVHGSVLHWRRKY
ncbi:MAG: hypothetical protein K2Y22_00590 [Candidatus Obscuribacterales bacterium]|nr:hypothetical protein [Candidatus Obscuribacterales bacterium]